MQYDKTADIHNFSTQFMYAFVSILPILLI